MTAAKDELATERAPSPWRVALALRWRIWRRRHISPLEAVALAVVSGLAWLVGRAAGVGVEAGEEAPLRAAAAAALLLLLGFGAALARRLLYASKELVLLLGHGLTPRQLVRLRLLELGVLLTATLVPVAAALAGAVGSSPAPGVASGAARALVLAGAVLLGGAALAGLATVLAWAVAGARRRLGRGYRLAAAAALVLAAGAGALAPDAALRLLGAPAGPGGLLGAAARGEALPLLALAALATAALVAGERLAPRGFAERLDSAAQRGGRARPLLWRAAGLIARPLGRQSGALLRRDLVLLARAAFPRGLFILGALPLALAIVRLVLTDPSLEPWHLRLLTLLLTGVLASAAGFLFGVDFPRARRGQLVLERTQPLRGRAALVSRWVPAAAYGVVIAAAAAAIVAAAPVPRLAAVAADVFVGGALIALVISHHAVTYGMRSEARADPAEAAAYPLNGGVLVILFAVALWFHPLAALAYPLLWAGFARDAVRRWETAELELGHQASA